MFAAIVRSLETGQHYRAELDASGHPSALSNELPVYEVTDHETGLPDWSYFDDPEAYPCYQADGRDPIDGFTVVHKF